MKNSMNHPRHRSRVKGIFAASLIILIGLLLLGRNLGIVEHSVFRIIVSWQMLLIFLGVVGFFRRRFEGGAILVGTGLFFLIPLIFSVGSGWIRVYWPLFLVFVGIVIIIKVLSNSMNKDPRRKYFCGKHTVDGITYDTEDGYVYSTSSFGSVHQIVLDPVFRGGEIKNTFGSTVLDLRRSSLAEGETILKIDCTFGGIELYMPEEWVLVSDMENVMGGIQDKRFKPANIAESRCRLILKGNLTFGGIEIKS